MMKQFKKYLGLAAIALTSVSGYAQVDGDVYRQHNDAKVMNGSKDMTMAWSGGVNHPQIAMADLNKDGKRDIVIFEEYAARIKTFIATGNGQYKYDSKFEGNFPENITGYMKLIDFNRDGIPDLVHRHWAGVGIFYGYYSNNELKFRYYKDLYYNSNGPSGWVNAYVAPGGIPGMDDIDGDGDIDIIAYDVNGNQITMYRNCSIEDSLPADSISVCLKDWCFGRTRQFYVREQALGVGCDQSGTSCKGCEKSGAKGTHGSNTLCLIDMDSDGDLDYFNGNEDFPDIQFFTNGKSQFGVDSVVEQDTVWGSNGVDMHMAIFPAAFLLDVNHDQKDDLLFTPTSNGKENYNCIAYYENVGTNTAKNYVHRQNNYLVDRMIDLGMGSYPVFYDYDKDGRKDLFIGSEGFYQYPANYNRSKIAHYKNVTTTNGKYSFELVTDDFLGLWAKDVRGAALAMGDLDNDSLDDLVIGRKDGTMAFYKNTATSATVQPVWVLTQDTMKDLANFKIIDVGDNATPCIYDIDKDGRKDLISGNQGGNIVYYNNYGGGPGYIGLRKKTDSLGKVYIRDIYEPYSYTTPYIGSVDDTEIDYLVVGTAWGKLYRFTGFQSGTNLDSFAMLDSNYSYLDVGRRSAPAFANLDNDPQKLHEMVSGDLLGGLTFYKQDFKVNIKDVFAGSSNVSVYPNPASNVLNVNWEKGFNNGGVTVQLVSVTGQVIAQQQFDENSASGNLMLSDVASGVYYCIVQSEGNRVVKPVSVLK